MTPLLPKTVFLRIVPFQSTRLKTRRGSAPASLAASVAVAVAVAIVAGASESLPPLSARRQSRRRRSRRSGQCRRIPSGPSPAPEGWDWRRRASLCVCFRFCRLGAVTGKHTPGRRSPPVRATVGSPQAPPQSARDAQRPRDGTHQADGTQVHGRVRFLRSLFFFNYFRFWWPKLTASHMPPLVFIPCNPHKFFRRQFTLDLHSSPQLKVAIPPTPP